MVRSRSASTTPLGRRSSSQSGEAATSTTRSSEKRRASGHSSRTLARPLPSTARARESSSSSAGQPVQGQPHAGLGRGLQHPAGLGVDEVHPQVGVDHHQPVEDRVQDLQGLPLHASYCAQELGRRSPAPPLPGAVVLKPCAAASHPERRWSASWPRRRCCGRRRWRFPRPSGACWRRPVHSARVLPPADNSAMDGYAVRAADCRDAGPAAPADAAGELRGGGRRGAGPRAGDPARRRGSSPVRPSRPAPTPWCGRRTRSATAIGSIRAEPAAGRARAPGRRRRGGGGARARRRRPGWARPSSACWPRWAAASCRFVHRARAWPSSPAETSWWSRTGTSAAGRIVSSNSWGLAAQCRELGAEPLYLGIARDTPEELESADARRPRRPTCWSAPRASRSATATSCADVLEKLGCRLSFWGVKMKPGFPLAFGRIDPEREAGGPLVFGLPGNPVSAMMTFEQFVRPALLKLSGARSWFRPMLRVTLAEAAAQEARASALRAGDPRTRRGARDRAQHRQPELRRAEEHDPGPGRAALRRRRQRVARGQRGLGAGARPDFLCADRPGF